MLINKKYTGYLSWSNLKLLINSLVMDFDKASWTLNLCVSGTGTTGSLQILLSRTRILCSSGTSWQPAWHLSLYLRSVFWVFSLWQMIPDSCRMHFPAFFVNIDVFFNICSKLLRKSEFYLLALPLQLRSIYQLLSIIPYLIQLLYLIRHKNIVWALFFLKASPE